MSVRITLARSFVSNSDLLSIDNLSNNKNISLALSSDPATAPYLSITLDDDQAQELIDFLGASPSLAYQPLAYQPAPNITFNLPPRFRNTTAIDPNFDPNEEARKC